ncbi:ParB/Srx family N-terminal domain-containing protein [Pantoea dispersa]|uniref:ParB/Srx family N-terminal domain-containing protein n=1 Tax=Pantoea dispersa TaxID=59814 RepID=UPI0024B703D7|nr:ParB/Srx family N-terminal domain-containing protein [Pantoea dispersa]MDI9766942.1 ParB/Srx family N-terminal domain-containing protein [Pantoea dispersa]
MSQQNVNTSAPESKESSSLKAKTQRRPAKAKADKVAAAAVEQALEKIDIEMIPLSRLAVSPLNVRSRIYVQSRIESLAATIKNVGLLHNLIAHDMTDGMLGVACGGRRLTALQLLLSQGVYQPDQLIPVKRVTEELARAQWLKTASARICTPPSRLPVSGRWPTRAKHRRRSVT